MTTRLPSRLPALLAGSALIAFAPMVSAMSTWTFGTHAGSTCAPNSTGIGNSWSCNAAPSGPSATATAWSIGNGTGAEFAAAALSNQGTSGFGVRHSGEPSGSPDHSVDSATNTDLIALNFSQSVALTGVKLGWWETDSDISVLYYDGALAPTIGGNTLAELLSGGWKLLSSFANVGNEPGDAVGFNGGATPVTSSWWLVSAYSQSYGGGEGWTKHNDYVKVLSVAGHAVKPPPPNGTPEPASLALFAAALLGMAGVRRAARNKA